MIISDDSYREWVYVIAFKDGDKEHYWRHEILDEDFCVDSYGDIAVFQVLETGEKFMYDNCDSNCYDFFLKQVPLDEVELKDEENRK